MIFRSCDNPTCHKCGAEDSIVRSSQSVKEFECGTTWLACIGGWKPHRQSLHCRVKELESAALNAAPQAEKAREIIERAEVLVRDWNVWALDADAQCQLSVFDCGIRSHLYERTSSLLADITAYKEG